MNIKDLSILLFRFNLPHPKKTAEEHGNQKIEGDQVVNPIKSCDLRIDPFGKSMNIKGAKIQLFRLDHRKYINEVAKSQIKAVQRYVT